MILIISENNERTTNEVIRWLISFGKKFIRVHEDEIFTIRIKENAYILKVIETVFLLMKLHMYGIEEAD